MDMVQYNSYALQSHLHGTEVAAILAAAIHAVDPAAAVRQHVHRSGDLVLIDTKTFNLAEFDHVYIVGAGKAAYPMTTTLAAILDGYVTGGAVVTKYGYGRASENTPESIPVEILESGHPIPDEHSVAAAQQIVDILAIATARDAVFVVISGGGSALMTLPVAGVTLTELQHITSLLLASGATINEINTVRKHIDRVKGGGLVRACHNATVITLMLSDVVANPLDVIASGPTMPDTTTFADAYTVLQRYQLLTKAPASIVKHIEAGIGGAIPENVQAHDPAMLNVTHVIVGSNRQAAEAAVTMARTFGYQTLLLTTQLQGEASECGIFLASILREEADVNGPLPVPAMIIAGGETTVTIRGAGSGGRNQELALAAVEQVAGLPHVMLVALATDGGDGPTDAAGAVITGQTCQRAISLGLDPRAYLRNNDSYTFFSSLGDALMIGPTQTNVNDLVLLFCW